MVALQKKKRKRKKGRQGEGERGKDRAGRRKGKKEGKVSLIIYGCPSQYVDNKMPTWKET